MLEAHEAPKCQRRQKARAGGRYTPAAIILSMTVVISFLQKFIQMSRGKKRKDFLRAGREKILYSLLFLSKIPNCGGFRWRIYERPLAAATFYSSRPQISRCRLQKVSSFFLFCFLRFFCRSWTYPCFCGLANRLFAPRSWTVTPPSVV